KVKIRADAAFLKKLLDILSRNIRVDDLEAPLRNVSALHRQHVFVVQEVRCTGFIFGQDLLGTFNPQAAPPLQQQIEAVVFFPLMANTELHKRAIRRTDSIEDFLYNSIFRLNCVDLLLVVRDSLRPLVFWILKKISFTIIS